MHIKSIILKNKIVYIYMLILIAAFSFIFFGIKKDNFIREKKYDDFSDSWYFNDKKVDLSEIYNYDEVVKKIPELESDKELYFIVKSIFVDVYVDDEKIYSYEDYNKDLFGKTPGTYFAKLRINKEDSGKEMKLVIDDVYQDKSGKIVDVYIGNSDDIVSNFIIEHLSGIIFSTIIIFIGVVFLTLYFILRIHKLISIRLFNLGLFAIFIGAFMLFDSKCLQILSGNEYVYHMISQICMLVIVVPIMQFIGRVYENAGNKKIVSFLSILGIMNFIICFGLNLLNIYDYHESLIFTHITYILCVLYIVYLCIKSLINKNKKEMCHTIGFLCICAGCLIDIILFHFFSIVESSFFTRIGVLTFLCFEGFQFSLDFLTLERKQERIGVLKRLAYEDGLTGLLNRTSFMDDMEELKECKDGLIAVFDVNNLKMINDTYGHSEGDNLIITASHSLKEYFSKIGNCYRIGGDEFVIISTKKNIEEKFKSINNNLLNYLNRYNKNSGKKYQISIAMGYSNINEDISIVEAFDLADNKMYKNKSKMKKLNN